MQQLLCVLFPDLPHRSCWTAVYGVAWELCEAARQYSLDAVTKRFPEMWPSDLVCANETYRTQRTYSRVEYLSSGEHMLWHGVLAQTSQVIANWKKGWIKVDGAVGPVVKW